MKIYSIHLLLLLVIIVSHTMMFGFIYQDFPSGAVTFTVNPAQPVLPQQVTVQFAGNQSGNVPDGSDGWQYQGRSAMIGRSLEPLQLTNTSFTTATDTLTKMPNAQVPGSRPQGLTSFTFTPTQYAVPGIDIELPFYYYEPKTNTRLGTYSVKIRYVATPGWQNQLSGVGPVVSGSGNVQALGLGYGIGTTTAQTAGGTTQTTTTNRAQKSAAPVSGSGHSSSGRVVRR